jgi:xylulokinase
MNNPSLILAVDLGTSGMKVALITANGQVLGWESEPVRLILTSDGGAEQAPDDWWRAFLSAAGRLLGRELAPRSSIHAVCCSSQGEGTLPVDADGKPLMNCILWMDMRGAEPLHRQFRGRVNLTGLGLLSTLRWIRLTGGMPSLTGKDPAGHMLLIRERFPEIYARTYKFLNVLDYLNLRLTGRFAATFDSILTSWVSDNRNPDDIHYDEGLVRRSGIEAGKFPGIVPCTAVLGPLLPEVADSLGLSRDVKVVAGAIDNTAAAIGSGAVDDYALHLYLGTSSWMAAHVPFKKTDIFSALASVPCAVPGRYLLTALQATAGGNLTFLRDHLLFPQDALLPEAPLPDFFQALDPLASRAPAGCNGLIYTPWIWGERAPVEDRNLRAGLYNLSLNHTRADLLRAVLEGVAYNTRWLLAPVEKFLGRKVESFNIVGGGAQSEVCADVLNVEIRQVKDPIQANARGAAFIATAGLGEVSFADVPALVEIQHVYTPDARNRGIYDQRFGTFTEIYKQMRGIYQKINA